MEHIIICPHCDYEMSPPVWERFTTNVFNRGESVAKVDCDKCHNWFWIHRRIEYYVTKGFAEE